VTGQDSLPNEAAVRAGMRRQQVANSMLILFVAGGFVAVAVAVAWFLWADSERPPARPLEVVAPTPRIAPSAPAPVPAASVSIPVVPVVPVVAKKRAEASVPAPTVAPMRKAESPAPEPRRATQRSPAPVAPAPPPFVNRPALEFPGALAANRLLYSIKCFDQLAYEGEARGRHYYSALCKSGARKEVSCAGASCRIEYAPAPSHPR
jgi:hypothetical protein